MTEETPPAAPAKPAARRRLRRPATALGWVAAGLAALAVLLAVLLAAGRYAPVTPAGRALIEAATDGLKLGRFGRLKIEGLEGDVWRRFTVRRLTISDEKGVWIEGRRLVVEWSFTQLLRRRLDVDSVTAERVVVLRRPTFERGGVSKALPVSVLIDRARTRVEMLPAFSGSRGVYDLAMRDFRMGRGGGFTLGLDARSVLHPGDFLRARADLGRNKTLLVEADAVEARGGAIAGALGLDHTRPFSLQARATGTTSLGKLSVVSRSGAVVPLYAGGAWSPDGGAIDAKLLLTSSRLLEGWRQRFGDEANFNVVGRRRGKGPLYDLQGRILAPNLTLAAAGPADMGRRFSSGLQVKADVPDMNKLLSFPKMGRGAAAGVIQGTPTDFLFRGPVSVFGIVNGEYRIAEVFGPASVTFKNGEFDIHADMKTRGGAGSGWQWAVAGPTPSAKVHMTRLKDGRILYRSIEADGRGLRLRGEGTQSIFNALNFKGDLQVFNLETAHKGAGGSARATWTATQKDLESPWHFTYDGQGEKFTSGYAELDRLLGRAPRVRGEASIFRDVVTVPKATLTGANAELNASGVQQPDGQIKYDATWTAEGPFRAGPVEIAGKMRGKGLLTGTWLQPKADLSADIDTLELPGMTVKPGVVAMTFLLDGKGTMVGGVGLTGGSVYGPARAKAGFRFAEGGIDLQGIDADLGGVRARGDLALRANTPSSADLTVQVGPGALLTEGGVAGALRIVDRPGGPTASVRLETSGAVIRGASVMLEKGAFTADGPLSRLPYRIDASGGFNRNPVTLNGGGVIAQAEQTWTVSFTGGGKLRASPFETIEPIQASFGPDLKTARLRVSLGGGRAHLDARQAGKDLDVAGALQGVDLRFLSEDFVGRFDADLRLTGSGDALNGTLNARLDDARSRDAPERLGMDGLVKAVLSDSRIAVDASVSGGGDLRSTASFVLPAEAAAAPFRIAVARREPVQGRFEAEGELQPLWDLFLGGERTLGGRVVARGEVGGSLADPRLNGQVSLQNGRFEDYATGLRLTGIDMQADLQGSQVRVDRFTAKDGVRGTVSGSGRASLERGGASDFDLKLTDFRLIDNDLAVADATGQVTLKRGPEGNIKVAGELTIDEAEINAAAQLATNVATMEVVEINRPISLQSQLPAVARSGPGVALDVRLRAPRRIYVRGRGLDVEMSLNAHVTGTTAAPNLEGAARIVRGEYEFAGKRFDFDQRGLVQLSTRPELIRLDLQATREDPSLTAVVRILGTAAKPEITLTSTPVLPNDEVLSQVLFGRSASQLSPLEATQLASALTGLASGGGFDVIGNLRSFAGLDRLAFAGGGAQGVSVAGGKYLTDDVYLEIAGGGRDGPSAEVEYRVNRSLSLISRLTSENGAKLAVRWRRDLGDRRRGAAGRR